MTEKMLIGLVKNAVLALNSEGIEITEKDLYNFVYKCENIYQIVLSKFFNAKKAKLIIEAAKEIPTPKFSDNDLDAA